MISGRPGGEHLSGFFSNTHTDTHTQPCDLDVVRETKVSDGSGHSTLFINPGHVTIIESSGFMHTYKQTVGWL